MKSKLGIIIFARYSSKRLRGKTLALINKTTLLEIIYRRLLKVSKNIPIIIATSTLKADDKIDNFCKEKNYLVFRGSHNNVLKRTLDCCKKFKLDSFVRVCCDRPFVDFNLIKKMILYFKKNPHYEIITNNYPKTYPPGLTSEIIKVSSYKKINFYKFSKTDKEHICNYFYRRSKYFKIKNFFSKKINQEKFNLTIDYKKDLIFTKKIYKKYNYNFLINTSIILRGLK